MQAHPGMRVLFASGLYDLCTLAGNTHSCAAHAGLPGDRVLVQEDPGEHGACSSQEGRLQFLSDLRRMISKRE